MLRIEEIKEKLLHLVGWKKDYDPSIVVGDTMQESESGRYFQEEHPLLTLKNIRSVMPLEFAFNYPTYTTDRVNKEGDKVRFTGPSNQGVYFCLKDNTGVPVLDTEYWKPYDMFTDFLKDRTKAGISTAMGQFVTKKLLGKETRSLLENRVLNDGAGRLSDVIKNSGKLVGFEITPVRSMGVTTKINQIGFQMNGSGGNIRVYIFHSSRSTPYKHYDFEVDQVRDFQWFKTDDLYLPYIGDGNNAGGSWFIVYDQNELPSDMEAVNLGRDWSREPCGSCSRGNLTEWRNLMQYIEVSPFGVSAAPSFQDNPQLWDIEKNIYTNTINYGLNLQISVACDLTDFIVSQRNVFTEIIAKQVTVNLLREIAFNPESNVNRNQVNAAKGTLFFDLNSKDNPDGIGAKLEEAYKSVSIDTKGLDRVCLSCNNYGVSYGTV